MLLHAEYITDAQLQTGTEKSIETAQLHSKGIIGQFTRHHCPVSRSFWNNDTVDKLQLNDSLSVCLSLTYTKQPSLILKQGKSA